MYAPNLYLTGYGNALLAGPGIVVAVLFLKPITHPQVLAAQQRDCWGDFEALEAYLDLLVEDEDYICEYERIPVSTIERAGYVPTVSRVANRLGNKFKAKYSLNLDYFLLGSSNEVWGCLEGSYRRASVSPELIYAESLAKYFSGWWIKNHYHPINPVYQLDQNLGKATARHLNRVLEHGPDARLHHSKAVHKISQRWLGLVKDFDLWAMCQPWLKRSPEWWTRWFPDCEFTQSLTNAEMAYLRGVMQPRYDRDFVNWLITEAKAAELPSPAYLGLLRDVEIIETQKTKDKSRYPRRGLLDSARPFN